MTITSIAVSSEPSDREPDATARAGAEESIARLLDNPGFMDGLAEATTVHAVHRSAADEVRDRTAERDQAQAALAHRRAICDPDARRRLSLGLGGIIVVALLVFDLKPLEWAAEVFGFGPTNTLVVTGLLFVASIAAMAAIETSRHNARRRLVNAAVLGAYLVLFALRFTFLATTGGTGTVGAALQAGMLSAISAALVWGGAAVLGRTMPPALDAARRRARRAAKALGTAEHAASRAAKACATHAIGLTHYVIAKATLPVPLGLAEWSKAITFCLVELIEVET